MACMGTSRNTGRVLVQKNLRERHHIDWINLAQDGDKLLAVVKRVMKIHVP